MILFMKLKELHGQVIVKNENDNIISVSKNDRIEKCQTMK